jgi:sugar O-acyltransferase (sialic acid O-acetyltransferase NeuD family)
MDTISFSLLGASNNTLSLILDVLYEIYQNRFLDIRIITNLPKDSSIVFENQNNHSIQKIQDNNWICDFNNIILGVGTTPVKKRVYDTFHGSHKINTIHLTNIIHPKSIISKLAKLNNGLYIGPGSIISPYVFISDMVTINRGTTIGHHTYIGRGCSINPGVNIGGLTTIGDYTTIGIGSNIFDRISIGSNTIIGAGSTVTKSIPDNVVAYGSPAKIIKENPMI